MRNHILLGGAGSGIVKDVSFAGPRAVLRTPWSGNSRSPHSGPARQSSWESYCLPLWAPTVKDRFLRMSGHEARTRQDCPGAGGKGARRRCQERRWPLVRSRRGRSRSGFAHGLASPLFPERPASRPPPGILLPSVVGSSAACMMLVQSGPRVTIWSACSNATGSVRQQGIMRHHRGPRPGKGTSVAGLPQQAEPASSLFVTGYGSGEVMLMPDRVPSPARG